MTHSPCQNRTITYLTRRSAQPTHGRPVPHITYPSHMAPATHHSLGRSTAHHVPYPDHHSLGQYRASRTSPARRVPARAPRATVEEQGFGGGRSLEQSHAQALCLQPLLRHRPSRPDASPLPPRRNESQLRAGCGSAAVLRRRRLEAGGRAPGNNRVRDARRGGGVCGGAGSRRGGGGGAGEDADGRGVCEACAGALPQREPQPSPRRPRPPPPRPPPPPRRAPAPPAPLRPVIMMSRVCVAWSALAAQCLAAQRSPESAWLCGHTLAAEAGVGWALHRSEGHSRDVEFSTIPSE
eukprot:1400682-Rhodomonas_salina.2